MNTGYSSMVISVVIMILDVGLSFGENASEFSLLASEQDRVCYTSPTCLPGRNDSAESPCCGTCTCDPSCVKHGVCCLNKYTNFMHAEESMENGR